MIPPQLLSTLDDFRIPRVATDVSRVQDITSYHSQGAIFVHVSPEDRSNNDDHGHLGLVKEFPSHRRPTTVPTLTLASTNIEHGQVYATDPIHMDR